MKENEYLLKIMGGSNLLKKIISMFVAIGIVFIVGSSFNVSHAYEKTGYKLSTKNQSFKWGDRLLGSSVIKSGWQDAISSWQNSAANAKFFITDLRYTH